MRSDKTRAERIEEAVENYTAAVIDMVEARHVGDGLEESERAESAKRNLLIALTIQPDPPSGDAMLREALSLLREVRENVRGFYAERWRQTWGDDVDRLLAAPAGEPMRLSDLTPLRARKCVNQLCAYLVGDLPICTKCGTVQGGPMRSAGVPRHASELVQDHGPRIDTTPFPPMGGHGDPQKSDDPRTASGEIPPRESRPRVEAAEIAGSTPASGATFDEAIEVWVGLDYDHLRRRGRFYGFTIGQFAIGITYFRKEAMGDG